MIKHLYQKLPHKLKNLVYGRLKASNKWFKTDIGIYLNNANESSVLKTIYYNGYCSWEPETMSLFEYIIGNYANFIDIGANVGVYSYLASVLNKDIHVFSIEPVPKNCDYIENIISKNQMNNIRPFNIALSSKDSKLAFFVPKAVATFVDTASLVNRFKGSKGVFDKDEYEEVVVDSKTLNTFCTQNSINGTTLIKIDVEEAELDVLMGGREVLGNYEYDFICELLINSKDNMKIYEEFSSYGYSFYLITNGGLVREDRPLTLPNPSGTGTLWMNHFITKKNHETIKAISTEVFGRII